MTTEQKFFINIVHANAVTFAVLDKAIGDYNKNIGVGAHYFEQASELIGSTVTENYDLASLFYPYQNLIKSDNSDLLKQSLQNCTIGISNTVSYSDFNVCTHISTALSSYSAGITSTFLSGQIYSIGTAGILSTSVIIIPYSSFDLSGNQFQSHLFDVPMDFAVYGNDNFSGSNYTNSNLIRFDYCWSYAQQATNLLIKLNFTTTAPTNYYLTFYWGNTDGNFISTNYNTSSPIKYVGTNNFISNIGILTTSVTSVSLTDFSGRKNFWSNTVPYSIGLNTNYFVESTPYLWAKDRINATLFDGAFANSQPPVRYPAYSDVFFTDLINTTQQNIYLCGDFETQGTKYDLSTNATYVCEELFTSKYLQPVNITNICRDDRYTVPANYIVLKANPKKKNLLHQYSIIEENQMLPSAFVKVIQDQVLWENFANAMSFAKSYGSVLNGLKIDYLNTLDNFIADLFFGATINDVDGFFAGENLIITKNTLKEFTQPYGSSDTDPINFSEYEEKSLYAGTNIVSSKEYLTFESGKLTLINDYNLPIDTPFEIYKPISYVCNGIDPYSQGIGLALDYTLNLTFRYNNQNKLNKTLYLMASKYLISQHDYETKIFNNEDIAGYYYLADPNSKDYNSYSVSSINEFRLYGYAGLIPDLKDGVVRPIQTRAFSPVDTTKYTYEEYVQYLISQGITDPNDINDAIQEYLDAGNSFYTVNLDKYSSAFVSLEDISICTANYIENQQKYWNVITNQDLFFEVPAKDVGFTELNAVINSGLVTSLAAAPLPYTIENIPVGYNNFVESVTIQSFGSGQIAGTYTNWVLPDPQVLSNEQPAQIQFSILSSGTLDPSSIEILNPGRNFSFGFNTYLSAPLSTGIGTTNALVTINMNNISYFTATIGTGYILSSMTQTIRPPKGYSYGFKFNPRAFVGLGYTSFADVDILIDSYVTNDSFLISNSGLLPGDLENFASFENPQTNLDFINYSAGEQYYAMFEDEIINAITVPANSSNKRISYITINCKLIEIDGKNPSGFIQAKIYTGLILNRATVVSSSVEIPISDLPRDAYEDINIPIDFEFTSHLESAPEAIYWVSIYQAIDGGFLSLKGGFTGITTSNYYVDESIIYNDPNRITVYGGVSTSAYDLDLGKITLGITSIFTPNTLIEDKTSATLYLRKNTGYSGTNKIYLQISTTYGAITDIVTSNSVEISSLSTSFTATTFTFNSALTTSTLINYGSIVGENSILEDQVYISRSLEQYDGVVLGMGTTSKIGFGGTYTNFNFVFNKLFTEVNNEIYAAFNYTDLSQFGLARPNTLRESNPVNVIDGYWSYKSKEINQPISIYPRSSLSVDVIIGTSVLQYAYLPYTHDIYLNIGYNSNNLYQEELIILNAYPRWKTIWMDRSSLNYKNFNIFNVVQSTYTDSIDYQIGLANTVIGINTGPKSAIFEGTFEPSGNLAATVPISVTIGTSSGFQLFVNNGTQPVLDSFASISTGITTYTTTLSVEERNNPVLLRLNYFTLSTAVIDIKWNIGSGNTLINFSSCSNNTAAAPVSINSGYPVNNIVFMSVLKTLDEAQSVNSGYPPGDSFVIRSS